MAPRANDEMERLDPVLEPLLAARSDSERQREIERLVELTRPLILAAIRGSREWCLSPHDIDELTSTVMLRLIRRLAALGSGGDAPIQSFEDYVVTLTHNSVYDHFRAAFPERARLKNRIRYLMTHDPAFAVWQTPAGSVCGRAEWAGRSDVIEVQLTKDDASDEMLNGNRPREAIAALLDYARGPLRLDLVVDVLHNFSNQQSSGRVETSTPVEVARVDGRQLLNALWREVLQLPVRQRTALLLNLREPGGLDALSLLMVVGVASVDDIGQALEMSSQEIAAIWPALPLDDNAIAERLDITRQQVINLRKAARERLARRMDRQRARRRDR